MAASRTMAGPSFLFDDALLAEATEYARHHQASALPNQPCRLADLACGSLARRDEVGSLPDLTIQTVHVRDRPFALHGVPRHVGLPWFDK